MKFNKKAFGILSKDEKAALSLHNIHNKSTWQAGEIMNKSHYKYLEIKQRAQRFFEMFNIHYETYGELVPESLKEKLDPLFVAHLHNLIEARLTVRGSTQVIDEGKFYIKEKRDEIVINSLKTLSNSPLIEAQNLHSVIMEFDRYNNFRVLPEVAQEPSAFKRRNKTRYRRHLEISTQIHPYTLFRIKELFEVSDKAHDPHYVALLNVEQNVVDMIKVKNNHQTYKTLTNCSIYIFKSDKDAQEYIDITQGYLSPDYRDPKQGLVFWPKFRLLIKRAINYHDVNNITPTRKWLMSSIKDMDQVYLNRAKKDQSKTLYNNLDK